MIFVQGKCHLGHDNEPQVQVDGQDYFGSIKTKKPLLKRKRRRGLGVSSEYMLRERDGFSCLKCGSTDDLQNDHVVPLSKGGWNCFENYQTLCGKCNTWKADRYIDFRGDLSPYRQLQQRIEAFAEVVEARLFITDKEIKGRRYKDEFYSIGDLPCYWARPTIRTWKYYRKTQWKAA